MKDSKNTIKTVSNLSEDEIVAKQKLVQLFGKCPIPKYEITAQLGLFMNRQLLSRFLFMNEMYQRILPVHGVIIEFGTRWGQNLAWFENLRGIYEPYNYNRKIIGFDTFKGFPKVSSKDGLRNASSKGHYKVTDQYERYLSKVLDYHESQSPVAHLKKYDLVKGDACETVERYLREHPETVVALAYFDFDLYEPTQKCLMAIKKHITKGTVIGFDELNHADNPGETEAVREVFGLDTYHIVHSRFDSRPCYLTIA